MNIIKQGNAINTSLEHLKYIFLKNGKKNMSKTLTNYNEKNKCKDINDTPTDDTHFKMVKGNIKQLIMKKMVITQKILKENI